METQRTTRVKTKYNDFNGGIQIYTSPLWVGDNESPFCKNVDLSRPGILRKAQGYTQLGSATGGDGPKGAFVFDSEDGTSTLYKVGSTVEKYASGWSEVTGVSVTGLSGLNHGLMYINTGTGLGSGAESFVERVYFSAGLDTPLKYTDGSSVGEVADIYAKHLEVYKSRLYLGNVKQSVKTYPSRIIYSDVSSDVFSSESYVDDFGEPITALKEYSGSLFVFSEDKLAAYDGYKLQTIPGNFGTTSSHTVQTAKGRLLWYNRSGVYMYAGGDTPQNISKRVQDWVEAISDPHAVTAGIDAEDRYNLYIGDVTVDSVSYEDVVLRYDLSLNAWDILPDRPFKYWLRQRSGGIYKIYASDVDDDKMWQVNEGKTLNGATIVSEWVSSKLDMGQPDTVKNFYEAYVVFKPSGASEFMSLQYRLDGATGWSKIGDTLNNVSVSGTSEIDGKRLIFPPNTQGKMIQFKLGHSSTGYGFNLYELNIKGDELRN